MQILLLLLGLVILTVGAEALVRGASTVARRLGLSQLVIGLTIVAFGTSAPELAVSVKSSLAGQGGIAIGNVIGSNIFNIAVILGIAAMICPLAVEVSIVRRELPLVLAVSLIFSALLLTGSIVGRWQGVLLVAGLFCYLVWSIRSARNLDRGATPNVTEGARDSLVPSALLVVLGLAMLILGGGLFVDRAVSLARGLGVSEAVIGLTIVAAGTSLPELATSVVAALRGNADMAIGNIVGSNLFNILGIAGIAAIVAPADASGIRWIDLAAMVLAAVVVLPLARSGFRLVRWEGALLFGGYLCYLWLTWP